MTALSTMILPTMKVRMDAITFDGAREVKSA